MVIPAVALTSPAVFRARFCCAELGAALFRTFASRAQAKAELRNVQMPVAARQLMHVTVLAVDAVFKFGRARKRFIQQNVVKCLQTAKNSQAGPVNRCYNLSNSNTFPFRHWMRRFTMFRNAFRTVYKRFTMNRWRFCAAATCAIAVASISANKTLQIACKP